MERIGFRDFNKKLLYCQLVKKCITDESRVKVGHLTLHYPVENSYDEFVCTGVPVILPHGKNLFQEEVVASIHVLKGFGKTTGSVQLNELGVLESPIMLTPP